MNLLSFSLRLNLALSIALSLAACGSRSVSTNPSATPTPRPSVSAAANSKITAQIRPTTETNDAVVAEVQRLEQAGTLSDVIMLESYPVQITATGPKSEIERLQQMAAGNSNSSEVTMTTLSQGSSRKQTATNVAVTDQASWEALWQEHTGSSDNLPAVDFSKEAVLAVFAGEKPTGGYKAMIESVSQSGSSLSVSYKISEPAPGSFNSQVITYPAHLVKINKSKTAGDFSNVTFQQGS